MGPRSFSLGPLNLFFCAINEINSELDGKVDVVQGAENAGKALVVGEGGSILLTNISGFEPSPNYNSSITEYVTFVDNIFTIKKKFGIEYFIITKDQVKSSGLIVLNPSAFSTPLISSSGSYLAHWQFANTTSGFMGINVTKNNTTPRVCDGGGYTANRVTHDPPYSYDSDGKLNYIIFDL